MSRLSGILVWGRLALQRAPRLPQLLRAGVRLQPASLHPVQSRLGPLQDSDSARQAKVFQVYLKKACSDLPPPFSRLWTFCTLWPRCHDDLSAWWSCHINHFLLILPSFFRITLLLLLANWAVMCVRSYSYWLTNHSWNSLYCFPFKCLWSPVSQIKLVLANFGCWTWPTSGLLVACGARALESFPVTPKLFHERLPFLLSCRAKTSWFWGSNSNSWLLGA